MGVYTVFNQHGRAIMSGNSIDALISAVEASGYKFYCIANCHNEVISNHLQGRPIPKRTSRGTLWAL